ncbi:hypothetical protein TYRP_020829 [Tyrophagus putrescentiae]|nr:hypothetical protein TYRP_020829 [Tyrophagus putrescentiae]
MGTKVALGRTGSLRFVKPKPSSAIPPKRLTLTTLGHCERPPTRAPLAPLARPESVDVHSAQVSSDLAALAVH